MLRSDLIWVAGTGMSTRLFRGLKSPLSLFGNRRLAFVKLYLRWQASLVILLMVRGSAATCQRDGFVIEIA